MGLAERDYMRAERRVPAPAGPRRPGLHSRVLFALWQVWRWFRGRLACH